VPILKNVLGLDLGSHTLKAVELQQGLRTLEVARVYAEPREPQMPLAEQIERMLRVHSFQRDHVVTALRGDRVSMHRLTFPFGEKRRIAQAVPFEIEDRVPFDVDEMVLDWELSQREHGRSEVIAVLAPRTEVSTLIELLRDAHCDARTIECDGLVLGNLCAAFDLGGARLLVDVGHVKTSLCAVKDGQVISARTLGIGGRSFTEALAQHHALSLEEAERRKHQYGVAEPGLGAPFPPADAILDRLASEIVRFANALEASAPGGFTAITLLGGGARLARLDEWLTERTGLPTDRLGAPREDSGLAAIAEEGPLLLAPALALALRGSARARTHVNLRQDDFARRTDFSHFRRDFGSTGILAAIVAGLAVLSFTTGAVLESREASSVEEQIAALYHEAFPDQSVPDDPVRAMREAVTEAEGRAEFLGVYGGNMSALDVLTEISRRVPHDLDVGLEELSIDKQTIRLRVYAKTFEAADRLGAELAQFGPFEQARIGAIETDPRNDVKKFNVTIGLVSDTEAGP